MLVLELLLSILATFATLYGSLYFYMRMAEDIYATYQKDAFYVTCAIMNLLMFFVLLLTSAGLVIEVL